MHTIDWILIVVPLLVVLAVGIYAQRYIRGVTDFLSAGRLAGRYLLAVSRGETTAGAVVFVAAFESISNSGFTLNWWNFIGTPFFLISMMSGFITYRYRETRAQTLAQFFEIRYNKSFRLFTGMLGFLAGILNFGIIPAVGARFFACFLGLPAAITILSYHIPTYVVLMGIFLAITVTLTLAGGFITVMLTDCIEGIMSQLLYLVIIACLIFMFHWSQVVEVLGNRPSGQSMLNPFDSLGLKDFNIWFVLMTIGLRIYGKMAWQNQSSYHAAALSAHESRMAAILGGWRDTGKWAVITLLSVCAVVYLHHPDFAAQSAQIQDEIHQRSGMGVPQTQIQYAVAMTHMLPTGVKGALCVILLMGIFGGDSTHLHSWGGLFIQDVLVPLRKKPFGPKQHIRALRLSIAFVALFAFLFGALFQQTEYIQMWWSVTEGIFVGGAGAAIIGGLYWKKGTAAGAWAGVLTGSLLSFSGIMARQIYGADFPLNGLQISFVATLAAIAAYIIVSLLSHKRDFNLEQMLHRGRYAAIPALVGDTVNPPPRRKVWLGRLIGFDENFTLGDKWIGGFSCAWGMLWFFVYLTGTIWNLVAPWPQQAWGTWWHVIGIGMPIFFSVVTSVWFTWGGVRDIRLFFRRLRLETVNHLDDGTVINHQNLDENALRTISPPKREAAKANET